MPGVRIEDNGDKLGLNGVELAVRPGYQVTPETIRQAQAGN